MAAYEILLLNTAIPQIQAAQSGDTYVVPRDIAFSTVANLANGTNLLPSLTFSSDTNTGIYREGADALGFTAGGGTNQMVLTSTGLGIGTNNPTYKLDVAGIIRSNTGIKSITASGGQPEFVLDQSGVASWTIYNPPSNTALRFYNGVDRMTLDSSGSLSLATNGTSFQWTNAGNNVAINGTSGVLAFYTGTSSYIERARISSDGTFRVKGAGTAGTTDAVQFAGSAPASSLTLDASGNLGIGAAPNDNRLNIGGISNYRGIGLTTSTASARCTITFVNTNTNTYGSYIQDSSAGDLCFGRVNADYGGHAERARITSAGDFLVGTQSLGNTHAYFELSSVDRAILNLGTSSTLSNLTLANFRTSNGIIGTITVSSTTTAYNTSSDYRLKNTIAPMTGALAKVSQLKPCTYKWNADGSDGEGFIAHELAEVCPQAVSGEKDAVNEDGSIKPQGIDTSFLVATLTAAIQEQQAMINELKAEVAALKGA